jgi:hypothetical protein
VGEKARIAQRGFRVRSVSPRAAGSARKTVYDCSVAHPPPMPSEVAYQANRISEKTPSRQPGE